MAIVDKHYVDEVGTVFTLKAANDDGEVTDISGAIEHRFDVQLPNGTWTEWNTVIVGTQYLRHTIVEGELAQTGKYRIQTWVKLAEARKWPGMTYSIVIYARGK